MSIVRERNVAIHKRLLSIGLVLYALLAVFWIRPRYERDLLLGSNFMIVLGLAAYGLYALVSTLVLRVVVAKRGGVFIAHALTVAAFVVPLLGEWLVG